MKIPEFVFAACRAGSEPSLKREVAARHGGWLTPAFMRPQLITWKARNEPRPDFELEASFSAVSGWSAGMARSAAEVAALVQSQALDLAAVHVFPRCYSEDGVPDDVWPQIDRIQDDLAPLIPLAPRGQHILDVIMGAETEPWFIGIHRRSPAAHPSPGALSRLALPPEAPSRAWLKMEQSLAWLDLASPGALSGKIALELGSAPGGASWALLQRGMKVIGVDTGAMDPRVLAHPNYTHLPIPAGEVSPRDLPPQIDLLASDMNLHPGLALKYVERLTHMLYPRWLALTLKINDGQVESLLPALLQQARRFAPGELHARQLPANRREITVISR
jgi:23S rRNA (cytidine2498-2'-O)-methyltransferase